MDWTLVALLQMFIITVAVSTAFGLRIRSVNKQNDELREHAEVASEALEAQKAAQNPKPEEWLKEKIEALPEDDEYTPLQTLVLQHAIKKNKKLSEQLAELVNVGGSDSAPAEGDAEQSDELKGLLQQFTRDSREMMACIQTLEKENAQLLAELGRSPEPPAADPVTESAETEPVTQETDPEKETTTTQSQKPSENRNPDPDPTPATNTDTTSEEVPPDDSEDFNAN